MISISKCRDTTWYRYQTFKVSKYRLDSSIISLYLDIDTYFQFLDLNSLCRLPNIIQIVLTDRIMDLQRKYRVPSIEHNWYRQVSKQLWYRPSSNTSISYEKDDACGLCC